ncbi:hypothetical protein [Nocardia sp. NPDC005825]|uniref:hypothetical protein n=1 Tax=unclassified Nocardia TaxID=2637762 RepID=UPI0033CF5C28
MAKILVVESSPAPAELLELTLASGGYRAVRTISARRALNNALLTPDLVIVGPSLANTNPPVLCGLRARTDAPILAMSSDTDADTVERVLTGDTSECRVIPLPARDLLTHVAALLRSAPARSLSRWPSDSSAPASAYLGWPATRPTERARTAGPPGWDENSNRIESDRKPLTYLVATFLIAAMAVCFSLILA